MANLNSHTSRHKKGDKEWNNSWTIKAEWECFDPQKGYWVGNYKILVGYVAQSIVIRKCRNKISKDKG